MTQTLVKNEYKQRFREHLDVVQAFLKETLSQPMPGSLRDAISHGVLNGGKRIRPVLLLETTFACGGSVHQALPSATALELIHCYSLIHDDLPCMDDDDLRRGQPTVHKAYGEALAVLAGDALNAIAFGLIVDKTREVPDYTLLQVVSALAQAAGAKGLVGGQVDDIQSAHEAPSENLLHQIHHGKTGALFKFATSVGAMLAGKPPEVIAVFSEFGSILGLVFQMVDDLLDVTTSSEVLGKTAGKDLSQGKITFPLVYGVDETQRLLALEVEKLDQLLERISAFGIQTDNLRFIVEFVTRRAS